MKLHNVLWVLATVSLSIQVCDALARQIDTAGEFVCALLIDNSVKCWGQNNNGLLGYGDTNDRGINAGEMGNALPRVDFGVGRTVTQVTTGLFSSCALLDDATVKCWGDNDDVGLGYGDTNARGDGLGEMGDALPAVDLGEGRTAVELSVGSRYCCAVLDDASLKCWGANQDGQLGYGDTSVRGDQPGEMGDSLAAVDLGDGLTIVHVSAGIDFFSTHTCAILDDASVKCWGGNDEGQLGYGDTNNRGDKAGDMGNALPKVDLGVGRTALQVSTGSKFTCALLDDASVKCWGQNNVGQLGYGDKNNRGDGPGEMGDNLPAVDLGSGRSAVQISAGHEHTCAVLDDASIKCWGENDDGQLGYGDKITRGDGLGEMGDSLPPVDLGANQRAIQVSTGGNGDEFLFHTCAVLEDGTVKCWGRNGQGQLGYGDRVIRGDQPGEMGDQLPAVDLGDDITALPTSSPSSVPSLSPSAKPSVSPSQAPTVTPSSSPTMEPSEAPSQAPTIEPSKSPTMLPSEAPSHEPSGSPSQAPTIEPSRSPTMLPSEAPSHEPSVSPSISPTIKPSVAPSQAPTIEPSRSPTMLPSEAPSHEPSVAPSTSPTILPSVAPSQAPTVEPSASPTFQPLEISASPSSSPSLHPSREPSEAPTLTEEPTVSSVTNTPSTLQPTRSIPPFSTPYPSTFPTRRLRSTAYPTGFPSIYPTLFPSTHLTSFPTPRGFFKRQPTDSD